MVNKRPVLILAFIVGAIFIPFGACIIAQEVPKEPVENDSSGLYYKDRFGVYLFTPRECGFLGCLGPDIRPIKYRKIPHADPATFRILLNPHSSSSSSGEILARDRRNLFYGGELVSDGDVSTLQVLQNYAKDKNHLYYSGIVLSGIDTETAQIIGQRFIRDKNGIYLPSSRRPRKLDIIDQPTFRLFLPIRRIKDVDYQAEDKNFLYHSDGGSYRVEPKVHDLDFRKLGCGYYYYQGKIFYSLYELEGADARTFRVLDEHNDLNHDIERCEDYYAVDKNQRYEFQNIVRREDNIRNHQIDLLLASPEQRKSQSPKSTFNCVPEYLPGTNFGYNQGPAVSSKSGSVKFLQYSEARILEMQISNADGHWQPLPSLKETGGNPICDGVKVERFSQNDQKPWLGRRDDTSISLTVNTFGRDPIFVIADRSYNVRLSFRTIAMIRLLRESLSSSLVEPYTEAWGTGWILENKFFLDKDGQPEIWVPLHVKNSGAGYKEDVNFVTLGFKYVNGEFECVENDKCSSWKIPPKFPAPSE